MANKKSQMYTQCVLQRPIDTGFLIDHVWIPAEFAKIGSRISLKKKEGWDNGWYVTSKGHTKSAEWLAEHSRDHLNQRKASDI